MASWRNVAAGRFSVWRTLRGHVACPRENIKRGQDSAFVGGTYTRLTRASANSVCCLLLRLPCMHGGPRCLYSPPTFVCLLTDFGGLMVSSPPLARRKEKTRTPHSCCPQPCVCSVSIWLLAANSLSRQPARKSARKS